MENSEISIDERIYKIIVEIEKPFSVPELYKIMEKEGISDKETIVDILGELQESGIVTYSEIKDGVWAYVINKNKKTN